MLLDQDKTRRRVKILAIVAALAFVGALVPVLAISIFSGGPATPLEQARDLVKERPKDAAAWDRLTRELGNVRKTSADDVEVIKAARTALTLTPAKSEDLVIRTRALANAQRSAGQSDAGLKTLSEYTKSHPKNAAGFRELGIYARDTGNNQLARLSFQQFLALAPNDVDATFVSQQLSQLPGPDTGASSGTAPSISSGGATPATP
jgi:predicted Zn-dependent protease